MPALIRHFTIFFAFFVLLSVTVFARDFTITVEDGELEMPLEGAAISLRDGTKFVCDEDGIAVVSLPDDRQTVVQISYPGYDTRRVTIPAVTAGGRDRMTV